ncbi:hypothetical protein ALC53_04346 [Atta colombica]|uniref:Uncharacterized protein n=1 Tax=Atta colombica TaxID=520822 RepID=A0A151I4K7_9HYME|nr:hypothetical protein ALC53_04346 [Atta colombica]
MNLIDVLRTRLELELGNMVQNVRSVILYLQILNVNARYPGTRHDAYILMYEPDMAGKIVNACAVLYNMRIAYDIHDDLEIDEMDNDHLDHRINPVVEHEDREFRG